MNEPEKALEEKTLMELYTDAEKRSLQALQDIRATNKDQANQLGAIVHYYFIMEARIKELEKENNELYRYILHIDPTFENLNPLN